VPAQPTFTPQPGPTGALLLFVAPAPGWGLRAAVLHDDDFDEVLAGIAPDAAGWHVLDLTVGRITGGSDPEHDKAGPAALRDTLPAPVGRYLLLVDREGAWGAHCIAAASESRHKLGERMQGLPADARWQILDMQTSTCLDQTGEEWVLPGMAQLRAHQQALLEWQVEQQAEGENPVEDDVGVALDSALPAGWADMSNDELRRYVEAREAERVAGEE
jgi:hypothetical protein